MSLNPEAFQLTPSDPRQRDPRICSYGLFLANSVATGGDQSFYWFLHEKDALDFLHQSHCGEVCAETYADEGDPELTACRACREATGLASLPLDTINQSQCRYTVRWAGQFADLVDGQSRFAKEIRRDFTLLESMPFPYRPKSESMQEFIAHLSAYTERFPPKAYRSSFRPSLRGWL